MFSFNKEDNVKMTKISSYKGKLLVETLLMAVKVQTTMSAVYPGKDEVIWELWNFFSPSKVFILAELLPAINRRKR